MPIREEHFALRHDRSIFASFSSKGHSFHLWRRRARCAISPSRPLHKGGEDGCQDNDETDAVAGIGSLSMSQPSASSQGRFGGRVNELVGALQNSCNRSLRPSFSILLRSLTVTSAARGY